MPLSWRQGSPFCCWTHGLNLMRLQDFWRKESGRNVKVVLIRTTTPLKIHGWNPKNEGFKKMILLFQRGDFQVSCYVSTFPRFFSLSGGLCLQSRSAWEGGPNTKTRTRNHAESHPNDAWFWCSLLFGFPVSTWNACKMFVELTFFVKLKRCSVLCCKHGFYWTYMKLPCIICLFVCLCDERMGVFSNLWKRNVLRSSSPLTHCQSTHHSEDPNPFSIDFNFNKACDMSISPACSNSTAMFSSSKMRASEELECLAICFSGTTARSGPLFGSRAAVSCLNHFVPESRSYHVSSFHMFKFKRVSMTFLSFHVVMMFDTFFR